MQHDYAARLELDWADRSHAWALKVTGEEGLEAGLLAHTPEAVEQFVVARLVRFPGRKIAVALELFHLPAPDLSRMGGLFPAPLGVGARLL